LLGTTGFAEGANIRSALDFCLNEHGDTDAVMEILVGLPLGYWWAHGKLGEGRHWLDDALARSIDVTVLRVRALLRNAVLDQKPRDALSIKKFKLIKTRSRHVVTGPRSLSSTSVLIRRCGTSRSVAGADRRGRTSMPRRASD
jgi:hypothetical protein